MQALLGTAMAMPRSHVLSVTSWSIAQMIPSAGDVGMFLICDLLIVVIISLLPRNARCYI